MEFVQLFLPMVENEEITGSMRGEGEGDPVSEFIGLLFILYLKYPKSLIILSLQFIAKRTIQVCKINFYDT